MKTILMTVGFVTALGMIGAGLFGEMRKREKAAQVKDREVYADQRVAEAQANYQRVVDRLNNPAPPTEEEMKNDVIRVLMRLRTKIAERDTFEQARSAAYDLRYAAEDLRDMKLPDELTGTLTLETMWKDAHTYIDKCMALEGERYLESFQKTLKGWQTEVDITLAELNKKS